MAISVESKALCRFINRFIHSCSSYVVKCFLYLLILVALGFNSLAWACPKLNSIPDFNCDSKIQITFLGDSLVSGVGDAENKNKGGYVLRVGKALPFATVVNLGKSGLRTQPLLSTVAKKLALKVNDPYKDSILASDIVVIDIGRNDAWLFGKPLDSYRNIKKTADLIRSKSIEMQGYAPIVVTAVLMLPNRGSQAPWVKELNAIILKNSTLAAPSDLRFDKVSKKLLNIDQIHPTAAGYKALAKSFKSYLLKKLVTRMELLREDLDNNGIYDLFEN